MTSEKFYSCVLNETITMFQQAKAFLNFYCPQKENISKKCSVFSKKRSLLNFLLKTFIKKGDKLKTFCSSTVGVGKITRGVRIIIENRRQKVIRQKTEHHKLKSASTYISKKRLRVGFEPIPAPTSRRTLKSRSQQPASCDGRSV